MYVNSQMSWERGPFHSFHNFRVSDMYLRYTYIPSHHQVENSINDIRAWIVENKLKPNYDKTEVQIMRSKLHIRIHCVWQLVVECSPMATTLTVGNIEAMIYQTLTMDEFVKHLCKTAYFLPTQYLNHAKLSVKRICHHTCTYFHQ